MQDPKIVLATDDMPRQWYNLAADLPQPPPPPLGPDGNPIGPDMLAPVFPMNLIEQEMTADRWVDIPEEILEIYARWRPTPLRRAYALEKHLGTPAKIFYKYEGVSPAGSHKPNTAVAQMFYNKEEGITKISTETGAGQWGSALSFACNLFDIECLVYMGEVDMERQKPNVERMRILGTEVRPAKSGSKTLKDATNEAMRHWINNPVDTHYIIGSVVGPHPYPDMVTRFQSVISEEIKWQLKEAENIEETGFCPCPVQPRA